LVQVPFQLLRCTRRRSFLALCTSSFFFEISSSPPLCTSVPWKDLAAPPLCLFRPGCGSRRAISHNFMHFLNLVFLLSGSCLAFSSPSFPYLHLFNARTSTIVLFSMFPFCARVLSLHVPSSLARGVPLFRIFRHSLSAEWHGYLAFGRAF